MRSLASRSTLISTLYVKSLSKFCDQDDIRSIFEKAREIDLCLLVFEDIDSLMSDDVKSLFLNEVNGLKGNDDIMMVGSINYCVFTPQRSLSVDSSLGSEQTERRNLQASELIQSEISLCAPCNIRKNSILRSSLSALLIHVYRSKLSKKSSSLRLFIQISSAIASIIEGFSFAYLQEAFVMIALLSIVRTQRANLIKPDASGNSTSDDLASNAMWQAISKQVQTLRKEMKDSRKSVEDAEKNSMLSDARSSSATSIGFGLSR